MTMMGSMGTLIDYPAPPLLDRGLRGTEASDKVNVVRATIRRNETIDVVRLVAAAGIVFVHAVHDSLSLERWTHFFRFAVPFYLFASLYFQSKSLRRRTDRTYLQYVSGRCKRLYLPFLVWSAIYFLARSVKHLMDPGIGPVELRVARLWTGTEYHLWFLPFLLASSIVLATVYWAFLRFDRRLRWPLIAMAIFAAFVLTRVTMPASWDEVFDSPTYAYVQFWRALPAACLAMAFAWFMTMGNTVITISPLLGLSGLILTLVCSARQVLYGRIELIPRALSGLGCMVTAMAPWSGAWVSPLARIGRYSYGIYLCHVLVVEAIHVGVMHLVRTPSAMTDMATFILGFPCSVALVLLLARSKRTAWLNG
jgi:peptidoglycan/LPS O-acetylase OafA/YrhL